MEIWIILLILFIISLMIVFLRGCKEVNRERASEGYIDTYKGYSHDELVIKIEQRDKKIWELRKELKELRRYV